jgi:hypothetical protein
VSLFGRRGEPLHERLLREAGLDVEPTPLRGWDEPAAPPPFHLRDELHGAQRPREWDAVVTANAPGLGGDTLDFVVLEDGSVLVEQALPYGSLEPLCEAIEAKVRRPYRARAVRKSETMWAVSARHIELVELGISGDELALTVSRAGRELVVDGRASPEPVPELELGSGRPSEFHASGIRVQGNRWELDVVPL